jgi:hypothetical protein
MTDVRQRLATLSPGMTDRILAYTQLVGDHDLLIQLEQDGRPDLAGGFRFWLYLSDGQLAIRVLMSPAFGSLVPRGANDCCLWQRDAQRKKWRRVIAPAEDLVTTWQGRGSAPTLTGVSVTNLLREDDRAQLSRQFVPDDHTFAARWVSRGLTDLFGQTVAEVSRYQYELIPEQVIRVVAPTGPAEHAAHPPGRPVIGFLAAARELDGRKQ